jgi:dihydroorotate dehydrogenase
MYRLLRNILFCFDPEWVHYFSMNWLKRMNKVGWMKQRLKKKFQPTSNVRCEMCDLRFSNPVGLGAGFDKNALYLDELETLGFGSVEIGTVTPLPQTGNDKPRLFRLKKDKALINRMGFNNDGVDVISTRLKKWRSDSRLQTPDSELPTPDSRLIIGGNIGKNKSTPNENAWKDYVTCFLRLKDHVDYFVVNVSSPNTPGLRELQEKDSLKEIISRLQDANISSSPKPILLKIAPDLTQEQVDDIIDLSLNIKLDGLVVSNTTISRDKLKTSASKLDKIGNGGLSGLPLQERSTSLVRYIHDKTKGQVPIIASGGIFTAADAKEKLNAGASLVQVWTGFIYEGPSIVKNICKGIK